MSKALRTTLLIFVLIFLFSLSFDLVSAQSGTSGGGVSGTSGTGEGLPNPLGLNVDDPRVIIGNVIRAVLGIVGSLALAVFIYGGVTWVISAGNEEKIRKGKDMITWASIGLGVIFASYALVTFVVGAITGAA